MKEENTQLKEVSIQCREEADAHTDKKPTERCTTPSSVSLDDEGLELLSRASEIIPANLIQDDKAIFTRVSDPMNPQRTTYIVKSVQYGNTLTEDERSKAEALVTRYADIFACSLSEVIPVPGAQHQLNIPDNATFNLRVHQRALTPPQTQFLHERIDEMLAAGIIERAPPEAVKCCATTVLAQKAH
ncbi:hypothetical protein BDR04DRAFT_1036915, partial [Suillus decipiens]